jgi:RNA polymerase-binding transcription factor DksA
MLSQEFIDEMKVSLQAQKEKLTKELSGLSAHTEMGDDDDENADEVNVDEASQDVMAIMKSDLEKIENALVKIENGTYGTDDSGNQISEARLRVIPWADKAI